MDNQEGSHCAFLDKELKHILVQYVREPQSENFHMDHVVYTV